MATLRDLVTLLCTRLTDQSAFTALADPRNGGVWYGDAPDDVKGAYVAFEDFADVAIPVFRARHGRVTVRCAIRAPGTDGYEAIFSLWQAIVDAWKPLGVVSMDGTFTDRSTGTVWVQAPVTFTLTTPIL